MPQAAERALAVADALTRLGEQADPGRVAEDVKARQVIDLQPKEVEHYCVPDAQGEALLKSAFARLSLSARAYHRILKVARTVADLADSDSLSAGHVAEAIGYRRLDRT